GEQEEQEEEDRAGDLLYAEHGSLLCPRRAPPPDGRPHGGAIPLSGGKKLRHRAVGAGEPSLITRDLLGGGGGSTSSAVGGSDDNEFQELDLDVQVPAGWEKRLDLKTGKMYLHRSKASSASSSSSDHHRHKLSQTFPKLQDLNFLPSPSRITLNLFDESSLELKLTAAVAANYQSVCTLDKVKSALERAERDPVQAAVAGRKWFPAGEVVPVPFLLVIVVVVSVSGFRGGRNRGSRFPCGGGMPMWKGLKR
ncbi:unnamed protein product, partial [Linum tenue]